MSGAYIQKLEHIKQKLERRSEDALKRLPKDVAPQYDILIETLEDVAVLMNGNDSWLDLNKEDYVPRSVSAPPASDAVGRMAWATRTLGLQVGAIRNLLEQNALLAQIVDTIQLSPIFVKEPKSRRNAQDESEIKTQALPDADFKPAIARQVRARRPSNVEQQSISSHSPGRRPSTPNLQASRMDDERLSPRGLPTSPRPAENSLNTKVSTLDLHTQENQSVAAQSAELVDTRAPRQFYKNPLPDPRHARSKSGSVLSSFLGKGQVDASFDPSNRV